jgi:cytoskeletal protein CcmA (bactofilin family)
MVAKDVSLNSKLFVHSDVSMDSILMVAKDVSLNSKLFVSGDVSMDSILMVAKDVSLNSKLFVHSDVSMDSILMVAKDVSLNSKLFVHGDVSMDSILMVAKDVSLNSKLFVNGDVSMDSFLAVAKDVSLNSKLFVHSDVSMDSILMVAKDVSLNSKLFVSGDVSMDSILMVAKDVSLNSKLFVSGDVSMDSILMVAKDVSLNSNLFVHGDVSMNSVLAVAKDVSLNSKLFVHGDVSMDSILMVAKDVSMNSKLFVSGDVSMDSILMVAKDVSLNRKLFVHSDVSMDSILMVAKDVSLNSKLFVSGDVSMDSILMVAKDVSLNSNLFVHGDVSMNSVLAVAKDVSLNSKLFVSGDVSMDSILMVAKDVSLNSKLFVHSDVSMDSILMVAKDVSLNSNLFVHGDVSMDSILAVAKDVSLNSNLFVHGDVSMDSVLAVAKDVSLNRNLFVYGDVSMDSILAVAKDVSLNNKLFVHGDVSMDSILAVAKDVSLNSNLFVHGDVSMDSILAVAKDVSLNSKLFVLGNVNIGNADTSSDLIINGNIIPLYPNISNLGSIEKPFGSLYVSNNTINLVDTTGAAPIVTGLSVSSGAIQITSNEQGAVVQSIILSVEDKTGFGISSKDATATIDVSGNMRVRGDASFNNRVDICGNLYAQYPDTSIPKSAISGPIGLPLTLGTIFGTDISSAKYTDISAVYFDTDAGFDITEITTGEIKVSMNSTFKYWDLSGEVPIDASNASVTGLVARGLDTMNFVAGKNINFELYTTGSGNDTMNYFKIISEPDYSATTLTAGNGLNVTGGDVSINNHLFVNGDASLNGKLVVSNDASLNSKLYVNGDASFNGRVDICGNLYAQYPEASIPYTAIIGLGSTSAAVNASVNALIAHDLALDSSVNALITHDIALDVSVNKLELRSTALDASVNALEANVLAPSFVGPLSVTTGDVSFNSKLFVNGDASFNRNMDISGDLTIHGNLTVYRQENNAVINTTINNYEIVVTKDISLNGKLVVSNDASLNSKLYVKGDVSFNSKLQVNGDASFNGRVDICGNLYAQYPPNSIPRTAVRNEVGGSDTIINNRNQSFYDIITQQPNTFTKNTSSYTDGYSNTTKSVTIYWTYDDILAKIINSSELAYLNFDTSYKKTLPNIDKIYIDVSSGTITNGWARYKTIDISTNYNVTAYKSLTFTKNENEPSVNASVTTLLARDPIVNFDVRIYGENSGANYPTVANRALIYQQISFKGASPPGQPQFVSKTINSSAQLTLTYNFNNPDISDPTSLSVLSRSETKYTQSDTLSSTAYPLVQTISLDTETDDNVTGGNNFNVVLMGLRAGTKYNFVTRIRNDLSPLYSILDNSWDSVPSAQVPYDSNGPTQYTTLPDSSTYTTISPAALTYLATKNITTATLLNSNVIYVNVNNSDTITPSVSAPQSFQITNPSAVLTDTFGYGKWIDNSTNLVQVKVYVDNSQKQVLSYNGFTPSAGTKTGTATIGTSSTGVNYFGTPTQTDIYAVSQTQGFRLYGTTQLLSIATANIQAAIGQSRSTPYQLKLEVTRDIAKVGGTATTSGTSNIYVDDLSLNPTVTSTNTPTVLSVVWTMGIPSVKKYKIDCARTYNNINSATGFIRGDRKLSSFTGISSSSNTASASSGFTSGTISIAQIGIQSNGTYIYDAAAFSSGTSNALQSLHYTSAILNPSTTLTVSETAYSLKTGDSGLANNTNVTVSHHFDMSSYTGYGTSLSTKLTLTDIYEITDATISKLNNDLGGLGVIAYTNHEVITKAWTLLYYGGKFQTNPTSTNNTVTYPNVTSYTWNGLSGSYTYNAGTSGLDLTGSQVSSGTRYKWVVFKLNRLSYTQYKFNGTTYAVQSTSDNTKYLSVTAMLSDSGLFNSSTVTALFTDTNTNAIGFCRATKAGTSINVIGNFKQDFEGTQGMWSDYGTATTGYSNSISAPYGSRIINSTVYGIYVNSTAINDDLHLFIGLKV